VSIAGFGKKAVWGGMDSLTKWVVVCMEWEDSWGVDWSIFILGRLLCMGDLPYLILLPVWFASGYHVSPTHHPQLIHFLWQYYIWV